MGKFEDFDWGTFWDDSEYALESHVGKEPTDEEIKEIEDELGYKLPESYIELIKKHNGGIPFATVFSTRETAVHIESIYGIDKTKLYSLCGELGNELWLNEWKYPNIGIAIADTISAGHHMVFLDYRECGCDGEPKVVLVDQEDDYRIYQLADNFEDFIRGLRINPYNITNEDFLKCSEKQRLEIITILDKENDYESIIEFLEYVGVQNLSAEFIGILAKTYNNDNRLEDAMRILDMIPEKERDATWYYRYGYSYSQLSSNDRYRIEDEVLQALTMLEKSIELSKDNQLIEWCMELVEFHKFKNILENNEERFPLVYKHYKEYRNNLVKLKENKKYKQITLDDVKNFKDIWDILEPIYWTIDIYNSYEKYLQSAEPFTLEQRYLNAINWYFIEVNNGGHFQFLDNLTGIVWEDTLKGFRLFGMMELADNFQKVVDLFGGSIPFDNEERWNALESMDDNLEGFLEQADNFVYDYEGIFEDTYIRNHPEKFIFKQDLE